MTTARRLEIRWTDPSTAVDRIRELRDNLIRCAVRVVGATCGRMSP